MPRYVPAGGAGLCIAWCIIPVYFIKILAFSCKVKTGVKLFHQGGFSSVLLHKSINTVEKTIYSLWQYEKFSANNACFVIMHDIKNSNGPFLSGYSVKCLQRHRTQEKHRTTQTKEIQHHFKWCTWTLCIFLFVFTQCYPCFPAWSISYHVTDQLQTGPKEVRTRLVTLPW